MYHLEITIKGLPPTTNSHGRAHWAIKAKMARQWKELVRLHVGHNKPPQPLNRAVLTLTRVSSSAPDADGLVSSFKHVIDGLVECGVLVNDKMANIGIPDYRHEVGKMGDGFIRVEIRSKDGQSAKDGP